MHMSDKHVAIEEKRSKIHIDNEEHLAGFEKWLKGKGLSQKTINTHLSNTDFYINDYLGYDLLDVAQGCHRIDHFLGGWFIRKASWSSCAHIKSYAAGLKKFYAYLLELNVVDHEDYDVLCDTIKECMPEWLEEMRRYEDMLFKDYF